MREIATVLGGIGLLIALYLVATNASGVGKVIGSVTGSAVDTISVLQGRGQGSGVTVNAPGFSGAGSGLTSQFKMG